jgi:hypothetical protein
MDEKDNTRKEEKEDKKDEFKDELGRIKESWNKIPKEDKSSLGKTVLITAIILLLFAGLVYYIYLRFNRIFTPQEILQIKSALDGLGGFGLIGIIGAIIFYVLGFVAVFVFKRKYKEGEMTKDVGKYLLRILICSLMALFVTFIYFQEGIKIFLWYFLLAFAICYSFFEIYSRMKEKTLKKLLTFPMTLLQWFFIPSMAIIIIILGSINGLYPSQQTFLNDTAIALGYTGLHTSASSWFAYSSYKLVEALYNIGYSQPRFMLWISICSLFVIFFIATLKHFGDSGEDKEDNEESQELIDETIEEIEDYLEDEKAK